MTQEQYQKALEINNIAEGLRIAQEELNNSKTHRLTYLYYTDESYRTNHWDTCPDWKFDGISWILEKHDVMIRQEIEEEIEKLKKKIEEI